MADIPYLATQAALTDGHIRENPTIEDSIAPSTAADKKRVLTRDDDTEYSDEELNTAEEEDEDDVASISSSILYPAPAHERGLHTGRPLPPLPDLRFEQSYLASIKKAVEEEKYWKVALITVKDQLLFPLVQGCLWNLGLAGWRHWNRGVKFRGEGFGAKVRRWWWEVNGWKHPK